MAASDLAKAAKAVLLLQPHDELGGANPWNFWLSLQSSSPLALRRMGRAAALAAFIAGADLVAVQEVGYPKLPEKLEAKKLPAVRNPEK